MFKGYRFLIFILILGLVFRLIWPLDMEWKADEKLMFELARNMAESGIWPVVGMPSGGGIANAGFSVWPFAFFYSISHSPVFMAQCVQIINIVAIFIFILFVFRQPKKFQFEMMTGIASYAIAVLPVVFSRKIWAQDLLPFFIALMVLLYACRKHNWTLILLGLIAALAGQLHLSGFYYGAGLFIAGWISKQLSLKQLFLFIAGGLLGMVAAIPWMQHLLSAEGSSFNLNNILKFEFWLRLFTDAPGINVFYSLGNETYSFISYFFYLPVIFAVSVLVLIFMGFAKRIKSKTHLLKPDWNDPVVFGFIAMVIFPGILMTVSGIPIRSHYLIGAYPFIHMAAIRLIGIKKPLQSRILIVSQVFITILFLFFVHQKQEIKGDYGNTFRKTEIHK